MTPAKNSDSGLPSPRTPFPSISASSGDLAEVPGSAAPVSAPTVVKHSPLASRAEKVLMANYGTREIALVRGEGCRVWDDQGREYLDFLAGIAVCSLGHCPPAVVAAIGAQSKKLLHVSNFFLIEPQIQLAECLIEASGMDKCLFCNTGTEAVEGALKLARLYSYKKKSLTKRPVFLSCTGSFHGRTFGAVSITHSAKCRTGFDPLLPESRFVEFNDPDDLCRKMDDTVSAIVIETVQGEGGIQPASAKFLATARQLCDQYDACLILDEIQCGFSRTGRYFAWQHHEGLMPDVATVAKAMGGGVAVGAVLARGKWGEVYEPGNHGTTFGGNPFACAVALAACKELLAPKMLSHVREVGNYLRTLLEDIAQRRPWIVEEVRGQGLMLGLVLRQPGADIYKACLRRGLIVNCTAGNVIRIVPPLIATEQDCERASGMLESALEEVFGAQPPAGS